MSQYSLDFSRAYPPSASSAVFKQVPEDFHVTEELGFEPSGSGEHVFLFVQKKSLTTERLVDDIARAMGVKSRDIGFCGLKDKHAVTEQWLSIPWPIKKEIPQIAGQSWKVLQALRHDRKLKRGIHQGNHFVITLKHIVGDAAALEKRLSLIRDNGFPNYFGEQRFGREGNNVIKAAALFAGELRCKPFQRSMYYSASRSWLFNCYLSLRVTQGTWDKAIAGDCFNLDGSNALFGPEVLTTDLEHRIAAHDIHPVGILPGQGDVRMRDAAQAIYHQVLQQYGSLNQGLIDAGIKIAWRPLRVMAKSLNWKIAGDTCEIYFSLPAGSYATALIRELVTIDEVIW